MAEYFAVLEYTRFPGWSTTWTSSSGKVRQSLLPRLEARLLTCIQRADAAGLPGAGVLDIVALEGVVGEDRCQEAVEAILSKADCPHAQLQKMFKAQRFVFFLCTPMLPSGTAVLMEGGGSDSSGED